MCLGETSRLGHQDRKEPYFSEPLTPKEAILYDWPRLKTQGETMFQPWNGYETECQLQKAELCRYVPIQTANIKVRGLYDAISCESDQWIRMACDEALRSAQTNGGPFGAIVVQVDALTHNVLRYWVNHNQVTLTNDPTAHAEIMAIRSACLSLGVFNLGQIEKKKSALDQPNEWSYCVIYSSSEPCPMCYAAICWANIKGLIFAATRFDASAQGVDFSDEAIYMDLNHSYDQRSIKVCQCETDNSLDAFNFWKRTEKIQY